MGLGQQVKPWQMVLAVVLAAAFLSLLRDRGGDGAGDAGVLRPAASETPAGSRHHATGLGPANIPLPSGGWEATGRVVWVAPKVLTNEPPGAVLKRPWNFQKVCHRSCRIRFSRWTLYGPSVTWLVKHGHFFTAEFPPVTVPCAYPRDSSYPRHQYGQSHDRYRLWWSGDHTWIHAIEQRTETGCYRTVDPPDVTRWHATRTAGRGGANRGLS
jgi:hypothetical protein